MRLVPVTNSQKLSGPRLYYKAFVGAKPARSNWRINTMSDSLPSVTTEREWAAFAAIDWADQKHFWRLVRPTPNTQNKGNWTTRGGSRSLGTALERRFGGRPSRSVWSRSAGLGVHACQVCPSGSVPGPPHYGSPLPGDFLYLRRQERP